ncbi:MAG: hypothetical protein AAGF20_00750 [Pseudomonadota bacterium]
MQWLKQQAPWLIVGFAVVFILWSAHSNRTVVEFAPAITSKTMGASPGGTARLVFLYEKVREHCKLNRDNNHLWLIDGGQEHYSINQRSGVPEEVVSGTGETVIDFEVPRFARPGPGFVFIRGSFECSDMLGMSWTIDHRSPNYPIEVLNEPK